MSCGTFGFHIHSSLNQYYLCSSVGWQNVLDSNHGIKVLCYYSTTDCVDDWPNCPLWAGSWNLCMDERWEQWMGQNCKDSCGLCIASELAKKCETWCSFNLSKETFLVGCADLWPEECPTWAGPWSLCMDPRWGQWMEINCKKSCGECDGKFPVLNQWKHL